VKKRICVRAAREVAGKDDPWIAAELFALVDMTERPVVVTLTDEGLQGARRVGIVAFSTADARV